MDLSHANIFVTGGAGTLGRAIARRRQRDGWQGKLTVFSTSEHNHARMRREFPDANYVCGDIRSRETLYNAMVGHDLVIHAAATKVIPVSEFDSIDTFDVNVNGSINVFSTAVQANIPHVIAISTDKACHPANAYGATKLLMEKAAQEYSRSGLSTQFHLVRYGNVLESSGSVIEAWKKAIENGEPIKITDPEMTRFWLSPAQAVELVLKALDLPSGHIYVAKMPALSIGKLAHYVLGDLKSWTKIDLRPGEKIHETLLTKEELDYIEDCGNYFDLRPSTTSRNKEIVRYQPYSSDTANELTPGELTTLLENV